MVIIVKTYEGQPNKCGTSTFFLLYRGLVHHHHRILNQKFIVEGNHKDRETDNVKSVRSSLNSHSMWVTMYVNI